MDHCQIGHIRTMWLLGWKMHWQLVWLLGRHTVKIAINILAKYTRYVKQHVEKFDLTLWRVLWLPPGVRGGYADHEGAWSQSPNSGNCAKYWAIKDNTCCYKACYIFHAPVTRVYYCNRGLTTVQSVNYLCTIVFISSQVFYLCTLHFFQGLNGATTVAGTVIVSCAVGIKVFVTGDILVNTFSLGL
jgi:hypothetical protein